MFCPCLRENRPPGRLHPSRECEPEGGWGHLSQEGGGPRRGLCWSLPCGGGSRGHSRPEVSFNPQEGLSHFIYVPFLCVCVCAAVYSGLFLPETRGKSFVEISEELHRLNFPGRARGPAWAGPEVVRSTEL